MGILLKNVFRCDCVEHSTSHITPQRTYTELHKVLVDNGIKQEYAEVEYPHTPERIKSYSDIADYKKDPYASIMNGAKQNKENLGDIRDYQRLQNMDKGQRLAFLQKCRDAVASLQALDEVVETGANVDNGGDNNVE